MLHDSPLRDCHSRYAAEEGARTPIVSEAERPGAATGHRRAFELEYLPYATPEGALVCELVASFGSVEAEYAAVRRSAALFEAPFVGTIEVTGADRREFLQRMVTQDVKSLAAGSVARSFWLNRKGRIDAELVIVELDSRMMVLVDAGRVAATVESLTPFVFSEDVAMRDASTEWHWLELHGPAAGRILALAGATSIPSTSEARTCAIGGVSVVLVRDDGLGEHGWRIGVARDRATEVWEALVAAVDPHDPKRKARPIGWHAYNIARVEAGTPQFLIDYSTTNLPHETGVIAQRVSFKKGCYLGQEVVARMQSLGKPKQLLVGLRPAKDLLPVAGSQVFELTADGAMGPQVGVVTSSTLSPMLGAAPIAFAMVKSAFASEGLKLLVNAEGEQCEATVGPLRSWPHGDTR